MSWTPNQEGLQQILQVLRESIQAFSAYAEWGQYLAYILSRCLGEPDTVREFAGLLLKHHIAAQYEHMSEGLLSHIKACVLAVVGDGRPVIRRTAGILVSTLLLYGELHGWPELLPQLAQNLADAAHADSALVDGTLYALTLVCEDHKALLDEPALGRPLAYLAPRLLEFFAAPQEPFRVYAVTCVSEFLVDFPGTLVNVQAQLLEGLFRLTADPSWRVRHKVCRALVTLTELHVDVVLTHMPNIVQYMMSAMQDADETVALEACEFWQAISEHEQCKGVIRPALRQLIPLILSKMVYCASDLAALESEERALAAGKDVKPHFSGGGGGGGDEDGSVDDGGGEGGDYDEPAEWNIRKCAAAGLDYLSNEFGDEILPVLLPYIQQQLSLPAETSWPQQECAILALGAVAEGCMDGMQQHLLTLVPFLLGTLNSPHGLVRGIACWTLSRYSRWIVDNPETLKQVLGGMLARVHDPSRKVQEAACSALATLEEEAGSAMSPLAAGVLDTLMDAFVRYESRNLLILYDTIGTLAEAVGAELNRAECTSRLMPPLVARWNATADDDTKLVPLLECLTAVSTALGVGFQAYAQNVYERCVRIIRAGLTQEVASASTPSADQGDRDLLVCSLDLIGGMANGLGAAVDTLVAATGTVAILGHCCSSSSSDVRQSSFALLGDLTKNCFDQVRPTVSAFLPLIVHNIAPQFPRVCCNAMWSLGEIAMRAPAEVRPMIPQALERIIPIVLRQRERAGLRNLMHNAAASLGRLGIVAPDLVAAHLDQFVQPWCYILADLRDDEEKADAFRGLCEVIRHNPTEAFKGLFHIFTAFASWQWKKQRPELYQTIYQVIHGAKSALGSGWAQYYASFPADLKKDLLAKYQLS